MAILGVLVSIHFMAYASGSSKSALYDRYCVFPINVCIFSVVLSSSVTIFLLTYKADLVIIVLNLSGQEEIKMNGHVTLVDIYINTL